MDLTLMIEGQEGVSWQQWLALAQACEQHGITTLYRSDHYLNLDGKHPERGSLDAWGTICGLAAVTTKLRLGTLVTPATFRHPSVTAKLVTTADQISGGRVELGLGAGWHVGEHSAYGFEYYDLKTRMDLLEEQLQVVLGCWGTSTYSFSGAHYRLAELDAQPKPVQKPHPPLIMGGQAGPRSARLAAAYADEYNFVSATSEQIGERSQRIAAACEKAGRDPIPLSLMTTVIVGVDQADFRERAARVAAAKGISADELLASDTSSWIVGTVDQAAERLKRLAEVGITKVMCQHLAHDDLSFIELLARELAPRVKQP
jgi:F420-dependent oxidoreductase-like protein